MKELIIYIINTKLMNMENFKFQVVREKYSRVNNVTICELSVTLNASGTKKLFTAVGKSYCAEDDNFDKKTGRLIARARAYREIYAKAKESLIRLQNRVEYIQNCISHNIIRVDRLINNERTFINKF